MQLSGPVSNAVHILAAKRATAIAPARWRDERDLGLESSSWRLPLLALACISGLVLVYLVIHPLLVHIEKSGDHYTYLAQSFVRGKLSVDALPGSYADVVYWQGHKYLPFGPLPALLLVPFLPLLQAGLPSVTVGHLFTLLNIALFYSLLGRAGIVGARRRWALLLFFFSTSYFSTILDLTADDSWLFAHVITTTFLLLAFRETLGRRRPVAMGLFLGLAALTRFTTIFALPFFIWMLLDRPKPDTSHLQEGEEDNEPADGRAPGRPRLNLAFAGSTLKLLLGLAGPLALLFAYNYARFGSPLESGYSKAVLYYDVLDQARAHGLFSLAHIPKNLFMFLLQGPLPYPSTDAPVLQFPYLIPSPWGMSILLTSPAIIYALRAGLKKPLERACWLGVISTMVAIFTYYGVGYAQFGFRYALDFIPLLVILAALGFGARPSRRVGVLVVAGMVVNLWGVLLLSHRL